MKEKKILIVKLSSIGDVIHTIPTISILKEKVPEVKIYWIVKEHIYPILEFFPYMEEIIPVRKGEKWTKLIKKLKEKDFDVAMDFQGLIKTGILTHLSGAKIKIGWGKNEIKELPGTIFYNIKINAPEKKHIVQKSIKFLKSLGIEDVNGLPEIKINFPPALKEKVEKKIEREFKGKKFVILNPGGKWHTKRWAPENFSELANFIKEKYPFEISVIYGNDEKKLAEKIREKAPFVKLFDLNLEELFFFISKCEVYVGGDTGPTHMASLLNKKIVAIYGPTSPERNGPFNREFRIAYKNLECSPCYRRKCRDPICMEIDSKLVFKKFMELV